MTSIPHPTPLSPSNIVVVVMRRSQLFLGGLKSILKKWFAEATLWLSICDLLVHVRPFLFISTRCTVNHATSFRFWLDRLRGFNMDLL